MTDQRGWRLKRVLGVLLAWGGAAAIALATLTPAGAAPATNVFCFLCGEFAVLDALSNILMFMPLGAGLALLRRSPGRALMGMAVVSALIEALQVTLLPGRDANVVDIVCNTIGGAMGFVLASRWRAWMLPTSGQARALFTAWAAGWLLAQAAFSFAVLPAPTDGIYYGQIARALGGRPPYDGTVYMARLDSETMRDQEYDRDASASLARALASPGGLGVDVLTAAHDTTSAMAAIVRLVDDRQSELLALSADASDVLFRVRTGARTIRLRPLLFRMSRVLVPRSDSGVSTPIRLQARHAGATVRLSAVSGQRVRRVEFHLTPGMGWRLLTPVLLPVSDPRIDRGLAAIWTALIVIPGGYWAASAERRRRVSIWWLLASGVALTGTLLIPRASGVNSALGHEVAASLLGLACGALLCFRRNPSS